jgi:hypothetical protein
MMRLLGHDLKDLATNADIIGRPYEKYEHLYNLLYLLEK